jgi:cytochrome c biogenesis protein
MSSSAAPLTARRSLAMVWRSLRSMRTALILLLLLALASIAGSFVPQEPNSPLTVARMFVEHPLRAEIFDAIGLFDVYGSWWFTLIYVLLLVSLTACLFPRTRALVRNARARPQPAREIDGFRHYAERSVEAAPDRALADARRVLRRRLFRLSPDAGDRSLGLAADKGFAREAGSLMFHWAFLLLLVGIVIGKGTGFTGFAAITEGTCWTEAAANYGGNLRTGRLFGGDHSGVQVCVDSFEDRYRTTGQPMDFVTTADLRRRDGRTLEDDVQIRVNDPAQASGVSFYQSGFGWAPVVEVREDGRRIASVPIQFEADGAPEGVSQLAVPWHGVLRLPTTEPQTAIEFQLWPDYRAFLRFIDTGEPTPMPAAFDPVMRYRVFEGDLGSEVLPSATVLDTRRLRAAGAGLVGASRSTSLEDGKDVRPSDLSSAPGLTLTFSDLRRYTVLQVSRDRGAWIVLLAAILVLVALLPALYTSRRKLWVRAEPEGAGSRLAIGGFALQRRGQFEQEFARLVDELAAASGAREGEREKVGTT